jgi:hypothetical protein
MTWRVPATCVAVALANCKPPDSPTERPGPSSTVAVSASPVAIDYPLLLGGRVTTADLAGRMSLVALVATYDTASQAMVRILATVVRRHKPRINGLAVVLEPENNLPLAQAFASAMDLPFPVAMADEPTLAGRGPFSGLHHVPSIVMLDRQGREVWRRLGMVTPEELESELVVKAEVR